MVSFAKKRKRVQVDFVAPGLTKQAFKEECSISRIMDKYQKTGVITHAKAYQGQYGDFTKVQDYQSSLEQVRQAQEMFMSLPSSVRAKFDNDPASFLAFVDNPANEAEMRNLGLLNERPVGQDLYTAEAVNSSKNTFEEGASDRPT